MGHRQQRAQRGRRPVIVVESPGDDRVDVEPLPNGLATKRYC
jgi:hypothetical protein